MKVLPPKIHNGFTLVELITSIAIVSVLAVLLISGGRSVLEKSLDAKCLGNLKTLHGAMTAYAADWEHWPTQNRDDIYSPSEYGSHDWYYSLMQQGYINFRKEKRDGYDCMYSDVLVCPVNKVNKGKRYPWTSSPYPWESNYAINEFWGDHYGSPFTIPGGVDRVRFPAGVNNSTAIMLVDSLLNPGMYSGGDADWSSSSCMVPRNLHGKGAHALLANGSVITVSPESHPDLKERKYWDPRYTPQ